MNKQLFRATRPRYPMPTFIKKSLDDNGLIDNYNNRPSYQRNDYIGWITRAKHEETQQKCLNQMLDELKSGNKYMKMNWKSGSK